MSFLKLLDEFNLETSNKEESERFFSRKDALAKMSNYSKNFALAALPFGAIAAFSKPANAQSTEDVVGVLNFALTLELLEAEYYNMGCEIGIIPDEDRAIFNVIQKHENAHVIFLQDTINSLGGTPIEKPEFDFTASGTFDPFNQYPQYLALSQAFEDTGVRAYKGQAGNVQSSDQILTAALRIHSVEARHAAEVRRLRTMRGLDDIEAWITGDNRGSLPEQAQAVYNGEANTTHAGVDATTVTDISDEAVTEAWDEPLTMEEVNAIASLFIVPAQ
ncbi:MAG: ferritin-like domain-containing protein [Balneolaceae bacterium]